MIHNISKRFSFILLFFILVIMVVACREKTMPIENNIPWNKFDSDNNIDALVIGHRLMAHNQFELALKAYTRAAIHHGYSADVLSALGSANLQLKRLNQAYQLLKRAIQLDDKFVPAWNNLGVVLSSLGKYGEAQRVFRKAFALDNGKSKVIRKNLIKAIENFTKNQPDVPKVTQETRLVRYGHGRYLLLITPDIN